MEHTCQLDIIHVTPIPRQELIIFLALDRRAEIAHTHGKNSPRVSSILISCRDKNNGIISAWK